MSNHQNALNYVAGRLNIPKDQFDPWKNEVHRAQVIHWCLMTYPKLFQTLTFKNVNIDNIKGCLDNLFEVIIDVVYSKCLEIPHYRNLSIRQDSLDGFKYIGFSLSIMDGDIEFLDAQFKQEQRMPVDIDFREHIQHEFVMDAIDLVLKNTLPFVKSRIFIVTRVDTYDNCRGALPVVMGFHSGKQYFDLLDFPKEVSLIERIDRISKKQNIKMEDRLIPPQANLDITT